MKINNTYDLAYKKIIFYSSRNNPSKTSCGEKRIIQDIGSKDSVSLSGEAKRLLAKEEDFKEAKKIMDKMAEKAEAQNDQLYKLTKCFEIAARIIKGDNVPDRDVHFLAKNEPEMFSAAIILRRQNDNPKDHKSLLDDNKEKDLIDEILKEVLSARITEIKADLQSKKK